MAHLSVSHLSHELDRCTSELTLLESRRHDEERLPNDFRNLVDRVVEQLRAGVDASTGSAPALIPFCAYFLYNAIRDASVRLNSSRIATDGGWRRMVTVVKQLHATVNTLRHSCARCVPAFVPVCDALLNGLWIDEEAEVGSAQSRNALMLGVLSRVCAEMEAIPGGGLRFLGPEISRAVEDVLSILKGRAVAAWRAPVRREDSMEEKDDDEKEPRNQPPIQPNTSHNPVVQPSPLPPPAQPAPQYPFLIPPTTPDFKHLRHATVKTLGRSIVRGLSELVACIDTSRSEIVLDGVSCFADAVREVVESIDGADLAVQAHWDHAVGMVRMLGQTAYDLGCWAVPLHKPLSETFFTVRRGLHLTDRQLECKPAMRDATLMSMLAGVGRLLGALIRERPEFFDFLGKKGGVVMGGMVDMLVAVAVV